MLTEVSMSSTNCMVVLKLIATLLQQFMSNLLLELILKTFRVEYFTGETF